MLWYGLAVLGGVAIAVQTGTNATLGGRIGSPLSSAMVSFATGAVALVLIVLATGAPSPARAIGSARWWAWSGGLLGATYVAAITAAAPRLGAGIAIALVLGAQIVTAVMLDHFGLAGFDRHPVSWARIAGVALIVAGVVVVKLT